MRELNAEDFYKLADIATKITDEAADKIGMEMSEQQTGIRVISIIAKYVPHELREFLAHVCDMEPAEFDKKGFSYPIKIARELLQKKEIKDFLQEMRQLIQDISKHK